MVRVTCLSPTKIYSCCSSAFAHLELLIFNLQTTILLLGTFIGNQQNKQKDTSKNSTPKQKKDFKSVGVRTSPSGAN